MLEKLGMGIKAHRCSRPAKESMAGTKEAWSPRVYVRRTRATSHREVTSLLKVAMLSGWHVHAKGYARQLSSMEEVEIAAVWDENEQRGREWAGELGVPFYADLDELLKVSDIKGVVVNAPTNMHLEVMVKAARAGKHIFTEKVLAITVAEAEQIASAVRQAGVKFCISYPHRTRPENLLAKRAAEEKLIGDVTLLRVRNAHDGAAKDWLPDHFYDKAACGGGALIDLGAHPMYLARWIMGKPKRISAMLNTYTGKPVEDNAVAVIEFADNAMAIVETSFVSHQSPFSLELYGTEGSLLIGGRRQGVQLYTTKLGGKLNGWLNPSDLPKPLPDPLRQWVGGILRDETIHFGIDDAIQLTELMEAAYQSHREGRIVNFD